MRLWRRARPAGPPVDNRPSLEAFVRRAAAEVAGLGGPVLEIGPAGQGHHSLFPADHHRWLALPAGREGATLAELPVGDEQFPAALCTDVGGHEPLGVLGEINRALERAGRLYLVAPLIVPDVADGFLPWRTRYGLNYLLEASGFGIEDLQALAPGRRYGIVARKLRRPGHPELATITARADLLRP